MRTRGYIDGLFGNAIRGWVVDLDAPETPLEVALEFDGTPHPAVLADERRDDLARAGIGVGTGGFRVPLGHAPGVGEHRLAARIAGTDHRIPLSPDFRVTDGQGRPRSGVELLDVGPPIASAPSPSEPPASPPAPAGVATVPVDAVDDGTGAVLMEPASIRDDTLIGENGWLFACPQPGFDVLRGTAQASPETADHLIDLIRPVEPGVAAMTVVLPDKLFVYPEHASADMPVFPAGRIGERLAARAQDDDQVRVLDLLPVLLRARAHGRVFSPAGAVPSPLGAFHAYRAVAKALSLALPGMAPCPIDAVEWTGEQPAPSDLSGPTSFVWRAGRPAPTDALPPVRGTTEPAPVGVAPPLGTSLEDLVIFHDRVTRPIAELLALHAVPGALVEAERPNARALAARRPAGAVWLVSDVTLVSLVASDRGPDRAP